MNVDIFETPQYVGIMHKHLKETIGYLFENNQNFAIACEVKYLAFAPTLPKEIYDTFDEVVLFIIGGYTFETAKIEEDSFIFEAGFGEDNFGSHITLPLLGIKQLFVEDIPIVINMASPMEKKKEEELAELSMKALLSNPKNKKLLQKKKK